MKLRLADDLARPLDAVTLDRFWRQVRKSDGCWVWTGYVKNKAFGYGAISVRDRMVWVHRFSYVLHFGEIGDGLCVCHRCDNPPCVRPDHLFLGSHADNMRDCRTKGRASDPPHRSGEAHHMVTLTDAQVAEIRSKPGKQRDLASEYGVSQSTIWRLRHGIYRQ